MKAIVEAPSRLHLTLIDLNGDLGRIDGGIGVALNRPSLRVEVEEASEDQISKDLLPILDRIRSKVNPDSRYRVELTEPLPAHVGLGSRTQTSLSIAKAISIIEGFDYNASELAKIVKRGGTSGIGIAAFENGGFILDGGHSRRVKPDFLPSRASDAPPPPILFQHPLPEDWYFVIVIPDVNRGAHGRREVNVFQEFCPIAAHDVERLTRIILMEILPAVIEGEIEPFGKGITAIQDTGFKKIECSLQDKIVKDLFEVLKASSYGYGMSSFGPAVFGVVEGEKAAKDLKGELLRFLDERGVEGKVIYSNSNNRGHTTSF
ncbi:MAG: beta-ribofuranosylaminobenzene 5'-phosphate synthase [Candidatus Syntrophoarchaeum sp.]|nr:beta-ribofuranosylaminobenzene 5'-phosphate synthase [Candidatus Syntrophoarchaeum sp.]